jgi:hypothetical protein
MKNRRCDGMQRGDDARSGSTARVRREEERSRIRKNRDDREIMVLVRTDSPPLHFRNAKCEPIISPGLGLLCRYCFKGKSDKWLSAQTINSNRGEIDGNTTTIRACGAGDAQRHIHTSFRGFTRRLNGASPKDDTGLKKENTDSAKTTFDPNRATIR